MFWYGRAATVWCRRLRVLHSLVSLLRALRDGRPDLPLVLCDWKTDQFAVTNDLQGVNACTRCRLWRDSCEAFWLANVVFSGQLLTIHSRHTHSHVHTRSAIGGCGLVAVVSSWCASHVYAQMQTGDPGARNARFVYGASGVFSGAFNVTRLTHPRATATHSHIRFA